MEVQIEAQDRKLTEQEAVIDGLLIRVSKLEAQVIALGGQPVE